MNSHVSRAALAAHMAVDSRHRDAAVMNLSRRGALVGGAGLVLAFCLPSPPSQAQQANPAPVITPAAFLRIAPDDTVTVLSKHVELGQGSYTGLAALVAEELDANWLQMRAEAAPSDIRYYANLLMGAQATGGSTGLANSFMQMRMVGAAARAMLVAAAANKWGVPAADITVERGRLLHRASNRDSGFGALADAAAALDVPKAPPLKDPSRFTLIGRELPRLDTAAKSKGAALFGLDIQREGMLTVVVAYPPKFGATVKTLDEAAARAIPGVEAVRPTSFGVAVYARNTWAALKGRNALHVEWDDSKAETRSSDELFTDFSRAAQAGVIIESDGDISAMKGAAKVLEAEYRLPYLAHTPMEPLNGVIEWRAGKAQIWFGCQAPTADQNAAAAVLGIKPEAVTLNVLFAGGSFGRRAQADSEFARQLAEIAKVAGREGMFKLMRTREDDLRGGYYRPLTVHRLRAGLDQSGNILAWENAVANQSILAGTPFEAYMKDGIDPTAFEGSNGLPYKFGSRRISWAPTKAGVPVLWWRSVGNSHSTFAVETFLDEVLAAAGKDPIRGRLDLLKSGADRERRVIERVAEIAGWKGSKRNDAPGRAYGFAWAKSFGTYVAQIVEVENSDGLPRATRMWCAVDCGVPVNPGVIRAQMEGSIGFGLTAALYSQVTLAPGGRVVESNWDQYRMLRIHEMPEVEVAIIDSSEAPSGVGEPGVPPVAPALANAWRALTGQSVRQLPFARLSA